MSFPKIDCPRRTDTSFRTRAQKEHHKETSMIEQLDIDMISAFPTSDTLHLTDLGIMRKCMNRWVFGAKGYAHKWTKYSIDRTSQLLRNCQKQMPSDIHRAVRGLECLSRWKGLEYRTVLLYVGMTILKPVLSSDEYKHFLLLCCAVTICSCKVYEASIPLASKLFERYVQMYIEIYESDTISSNVHNLIHITEDMMSLKINNLMDLSTYKYENALRLIGLKVKHCNLPLEQVARRIIEMSRIEKDQLANSNFEFTEKFLPKVFYKTQNQNFTTYDKIELKPNVFLSNRKIGDSWFLARSSDAKLQIVKMKYVVVNGEQYEIWGLPLKEKREFFNYPLTSTKLNIYTSNGETVVELCIYNIDSFVAKMICLTCDESSFVYMPILHTLTD